MERNNDVDWNAIDDVIYGCANQAGEDNRNVARMALLLAGLPQGVPGSTVNRLCGSGMDAVGIAARAIKSGEAELMIAGGVESMSRAPFVMGKADQRVFAPGRDFRHDHRLAFREPADEEQSTAWIRCRRRPKTSRPNTRSAAPIRTRLRCAASSKPRARNATGRFAQEIVPVTIAQKKGDPMTVSQDEHPRRNEPRSARQTEGRRARRTAR